MGKPNIIGLGEYTDEDLQTELARRKARTLTNPEAVDAIRKALNDNTFEYTGVRSLVIFSDNKNKFIEVSWKVTE